MKNQHYNFKVLAVYSDYLIVAQGYSIYKYSHDGNILCSIGKIYDNRYTKFARCKFLRRLLRAEITALYELNNGNLLVIAKKGLFMKEHNNQGFRKVFDIPRGSRPLNLCITKSGKIYFGEYFQNNKRSEVYVYGSVDGALTWKIIYAFPEGNINHIHGIFNDPYSDRIWFVTGDNDNECIIGWTDDEFRSVHEAFRGGQEYRCCQLFFYNDFIVFATDSQYIRNRICKIDRMTMGVTELKRVQGSVIKGGQYGNISFLSTTVEPSGINRDTCTYVWISKDGVSWEEIFKVEKDLYPSILQYATIEFPQYYHIENKLYFSGRAVREIDGKTTFITL